MPFKFSVVEVPQKQIAGIHVQTDMQNASKDCPALWESFGPGLCSNSPHCIISQTAPTYGVSIMLDENRFVYWAAGEVACADPLPQGVETMTIPAGLYVKCTAASLEQLGEAYTALYTQWPGSQNTHALNMQGLCFEQYAPNWQLNDPLEIYASVIKK